MLRFSEKSRDPGSNWYNTAKDGARTLSAGTSDIVKDRCIQESTTARYAEEAH